MLAFTAMGKPPSGHKVFYLCNTERKFLLAMRVESMTFRLQELLWSFIANGVASRLGQVTDLLREVVFGGNLRGLAGGEVRERCAKGIGAGSEDEDAFYNTTLLQINTTVLY
jgi:hypothetical protein